MHKIQGTKQTDRTKSYLAAKNSIKFYHNPGAYKKYAQDTRHKTDRSY